MSGGVNHGEQEQGQLGGGQDMRQEDCKTGRLTSQKVKREVSHLSLVNRNRAGDLDLERNPGPRGDLTRQEQG